MLGQIRDLIVQELALYPGRLSVMTRTVLSATIIALLIITFQLPAASLAAFYTFLLARDSPDSTVRSGGRITLAFVMGAAYTVVGVMLAVNYPLTHFLWVVGTLFLIFSIIRVVPDYASAAAFSFVIATAIPAWDLTGPVEARLAATLWTTLSIAVGVIVTIAVEYVFAAFGPTDSLGLELQDRLSTLQNLFGSLAEQQTVPEPVAAKLRQYATVGSSRLRQLLVRSRKDPSFQGPMNAAVSLVDRAIDIGAGLTQLEVQASDNEKQRLSALHSKTGAIRMALAKGETPQAEPVETGAEPAPGIPVLPELERTIRLIPHAFTGEGTFIAPQSVMDEPTRRNTLVVEDAWTNPEHVYFALRGTLAATAAYLLYNALDWPGISTALPTCIITALSNIGASRQKQVLRLVGAILGGFVFGLFAQTILLPAIDSVTGFLIVFAGITFIAAWLSTASPRISYAGLQIALAWDLITLGEPLFQTSLAIARDRVVGVLVGILCMWAFFEPFQKVTAAEYMLNIFEANLLAMARLTRVLDEENNRSKAIQTIRKLRDQLTTGFLTVNTQGDAVAFEFGPGRRDQIAVRDSILRWQPRLRTLLLLNLTTLRYRIEIQMNSVAPRIREAQSDWDNALASTMESLAARIRGAPRDAFDEGDLKPALDSLCEAVNQHYQANPPERARAILAISKTMTDVLINLKQDMYATTLPERAHVAQVPENRSPTMQTR